ncbi:MAG: esterase family protein, partial [Okeania sp. SIO3C4]|nr:esterase family protein [Okeania sp. SIO3C4]
MRKLWSVLFFSVLFIGAMAQGKVIEGLTMKSKTVSYNVNYSVYLPPDYDLSKRSYPVLYLLHGYTDNETAWVQFGEVNRIADKAIEDGTIPPMIIVMPDAKVTWYVNNHSGKDNYEDMMIKEFIPHVEKQYRIRSQREFRAVSGLSMGGNGALMWAMRHPELFAACAAFSSAVFTDEEIISGVKNDDNDWFERIYGKMMNDETPKHWKDMSVLYMVERMKKEELSRVKYYIDCGDDDFLYRGNAALHIALRKKEV